MPSYAVAHMRQVTMGPAVVEYLQRIDATLAPFGGRFIVHGGEVEVMEGNWPGHLAMLAASKTSAARGRTTGGLSADSSPARFMAALFGEAASSWRVRQDR